MVVAIGVYHVRKGLRSDFLGEIDLRYPFWGAALLALCNFAYGWFVLAGSLVTGWLAGPALRRLPEPAVAEGETKVPYRQLATRRFATGVTACSMAALIVVALRVEPAMWTAWDLARGAPRPA